MTHLRARHIWLRLHRWLGGLLGVWFLLLGLTGSVLVFYRGLDEWLDPRLAPRAVLPTTPPPRMEAVYQALLAAHPQRGPGWRIELPRAPGEAITARLNQPAETRGQGFAPLLSTVDPVTLQVVANRLWGRHLSTWLYDLHYSLLLGNLGLQLVGWGGLLMALSLLTGLWLWWPARGHWRSALHFKRGAVAVRRVYDLHKLAGLYGAVPLLVLSVTGFALALPGTVRPLLASVSPLTPMPQVPRAPSQPTDTPRLPVDAAIRAAQARFAGSQARWIDMPAAPGAPYRVRLHQPGEAGDRFPDTYAWIDAASGRILAERDPTVYTAGDNVWQWMHPLHSGEGFGLAGRLLVCVSGVLAALLAITGLLRWRDKRRAKALRTGPRRPRT